MRLQLQPMRLQARSLTLPPATSPAQSDRTSTTPFGDTPGVGTSVMFRCSLQGQLPRRAVQTGLVSGPARTGPAQSALLQCCTSSSCSTAMRTVRDECIHDAQPDRCSCSCCCCVGVGTSAPSASVVVVQAAATPIYLWQPLLPQARAASSCCRRYLSWLLPGPLWAGPGRAGLTLLRALCMHAHGTGFRNWLACLRTHDPIQMLRRASDRMA